MQFLLLECQKYSSGIRSSLCLYAGKEIKPFRVLFVLNLSHQL